MLHKAHPDRLSDVAAQQPPLRVLRGAAFGGVLRLVLVVVGLVVFDDVVLAAEQGDHACGAKRNHI